MNAFAKYFASIYMNLLVRDEEILKKNTMQCVIKLIIYLKRI